MYIYSTTAVWLVLYVVVQWSPFLVLRLISIEYVSIEVPTTINLLPNNYIPIKRKLNKYYENCLVVINQLLLTFPWGVEIVNQTFWSIFNTLFLLPIYFVHSCVSIYQTFRRFIRQSFAINVHQNLMNIIHYVVHLG